MITKEEIQEIASQKQLDLKIIEKDYVLSWILSGIHQHKDINNTWIFKGGTCLKKCYFETYRFSEDLDFTILEKINPDENYYKNIFTDIGTWIYDNIGIGLPKEGIDFEIFQNNRGSLSVQGKLSYRGPIQPNLNISRLQRIKLDLKFDEPLILDPIIKEVFHTYSDKQANSFKILAYSYEEIFAEKLRALMQRLRPRDLYDVIHLYKHKDLLTDRALLKQTLIKKCEIRSTPYPTFNLINNHHNRKLVESEWSTQLTHQLSLLPSFEEFLEGLKEVLNWLDE